MILTAAGEKINAGKRGSADSQKRAEEISRKMEPGQIPKEVVFVIEALRKKASSPVVLRYAGAGQ